MIAAGAGLAFARLAVAQAPVAAEPAKLPERNIQLFNTHTRETVKVVFKRGDQYDESALAALKNVLRDHRNGQSHDMDAGLYDQLYELALAAKREPHYEIISGYRSPESNNQMSARPGSGVGLGTGFALDEGKHAATLKRTSATSCWSGGSTAGAEKMASGQSYWTLGQ